MASLARRARAGETLENGLNRTQLWPVEFAAAVGVGERTGRLDEVLDRLARQARERYTAAVETCAEWLPRAAYARLAFFMIAGILTGVAQISSAYTQNMR